jgi:hypothetical protein
MSLSEIYGSDQEAYRKLKIKWQRRNLEPKSYGVEKSIKKLENKLKIPQAKRVLPDKL